MSIEEVAVILMHIRDGVWWWRCSVVARHRTFAHVGHWLQRSRHGVFLPTLAKSREKEDKRARLLVTRSIKGNCEKSEHQRNARAVPPREPPIRRVERVLASAVPRRPSLETERFGEIQCKLNLWCNAKQAATEIHRARPRWTPHAPPCTW